MQTFFKLITFIFVLFFMSGCTKSVESQIQEYLAFYYPSSGSYYYQITFEWGDYLIDTGAAADEQLHPDSEKYRGYISARPSVPVTPENEKLYTYLVTPKGKVWRTDAQDIPETVTRQEVLEEKTAHGTSTSTTTINSTMEPVIEHFLSQPEDWQNYGLVESDGSKTIFRPAGN